MSEIKLTKNCLREEQKKLSRLEKYLPTLQLKKAMLQIEVQGAREEVALCNKAKEKALANAMEQSKLLTETAGFSLEEALEVVSVDKEMENIAGVEVFRLQSVLFAKPTYSLLSTPIWLDGLIEVLQEAKRADIAETIAREKKQALEKELREVSIRVNLFEKVLIPRALKTIKKIKVFLDDQSLAAVSQAKAAKRLLEAKKVGHAG